MKLIRIASKRVRRIMGGGTGDDARWAEKAKKRRARFESQLWNREAQIAKRNYTDYEDYVAHQASKLSGIRHRLDETAQEDLREFVRRFAGCEPLRNCEVVLCLGARLGTEVKALHQLGHFAVGVDLNPGPNNSYVLTGDFHQLVFPDGSIDAVYTNSLDHAFDLPKVVGEVARVLKSGGIFIIDLVRGYEEGYIPGEFEAMHWANADALVARIAELGGFDCISQTNLGLHRRDEWLQRCLRKR